MNQQIDVLAGKRQSYPCRMTGNEAENFSGKIQMRREMINEDPYSKGLPPIKDSGNHKASITSLEGS